MSIRQSRILVSMACVVLALMLVAMDCTYGGALAPPFDTEPFNTDTTGNAGSNFEGSFRRLGGPPQFRYFLGTEPLPAGPGRLILTFSLFTDGPGNDFAILTNGQSWGPLADKALFEFFLGDTLQTSFAAALAPDRLFEFELPGDDVVANRVVVTNITPDPPGVNNLAGMTFDAAGVSHPVTEPSTFLLLLIGLGSLLAMGREAPRSQSELGFIESTDDDRIRVGAKGAWLHTQRSGWVPWSRYSNGGNVTWEDGRTDGAG